MLISDEVCNCVGRVVGKVQYPSHKFKFKYHSNYHRVTLLSLLLRDDSSPTGGYSIERALKDEKSPEKVYQNGI